MQFTLHRPLTPALYHFVIYDIVYNVQIRCWQRPARLQPEGAQTSQSAQASAASHPAQQAPACSEHASDDGQEAADAAEQQQEHDRYTASPIKHARDYSRSSRQKPRDIELAKPS